MTSTTSPLNCLYTVIAQRPMVLLMRAQVISMTAKRQDWLVMGRRIESIYEGTLESADQWRISSLIED